MKLTERVRSIIDANAPPHLRNYMYQMVEKESSGNPNLKSSTGASGLLQFTKGTGKLYGLVGKDYDNRNDPVANIQAGVKLTEDNRNTMRRILGREPSESELALGHQQGAQTAAQMITGTGNAPKYNLMVNNVPANASPQEAARHIMNYYGFNKNQQVPGMTLAYNPLLPQLQQPTPTAESPLPANYAVPQQPMVAAPTIPDTSVAAPAQDAASSFGLGKAPLGADGKGGPNSPYGMGMSGLEDIAKSIDPKVSAQAAAEAARISPMSGGMDNTGQIAGGAQTLLQQIMANRKKNLGLTLTGR